MDFCYKLCSLKYIVFYTDINCFQVEYDVAGFLEKNRDRLPVEIINILRGSENSVVKTIFKTPLSKTGMFQIYLNFNPKTVMHYIDITI